MSSLIGALVLLLLVAAAALGAVDTRDGRDWQPRDDPRWSGRP